jgi:hypothetical protein
MFVSMSNKKHDRNKYAAISGHRCNSVADNVKSTDLRCPDIVHFDKNDLPESQSAVLFTLQSLVYMFSPCLSLTVPCATIVSDRKYKTEDTCVPHPNGNARRMLLFRLTMPQ